MCGAYRLGLAMRVLLLEDDAIGEGLSRTLAEEGISVDWVRTERRKPRSPMAVMRSCDRAARPPAAWH